MKKALVPFATSALSLTLIIASANAREPSEQEAELPPHIAKLYAEATEDTKRQGAYFGLIMENCNATTGMANVDDVLRSIFNYERDSNSARYVEFLEGSVLMQEALGMDGYCDFTIETTKGQLSRK